MRVPENSRKRHHMAANDPETPVNDTPGRLAGDALTMDPPSAIALFAAAIVLLTAAYAVIFALTIPARIGDALMISVANVLPLAALSAATWFGLRKCILPLPVLAQTASHVLLAPSFAVAWYVATLVCLGLRGAIETGSFQMGEFGALAFVWQMFQGIVLYALVAAITYALRGGRMTSVVSLVREPQTIERYLIKSSDEFVPIVVGEIATVRGAQDYAEVTLRDGSSHLIRLSLAEMASRLPADRFVRVHRSTIINLAHLVRAEPAGSGRMTLHLPGGPVDASRTGTQLLRQRML